MDPRLMATMMMMGERQMELEETRGALSKAQQTIQEQGERIAFLVEKYEQKVGTKKDKAA